MICILSFIVNADRIAVIVPKSVLLGHSIFVYQLHVYSRFCMLIRGAISLCNMDLTLFNQSCCTQVLFKDTVEILFKLY